MLGYPQKHATRNLTHIAFFLMLRPGEYCREGTDKKQHPFRLRNVPLFIGRQPYNTATTPQAIINQAYFSSILFATQKNGIKGELIVHVCTGQLQGYLVAAICTRVVHLR